MTIIGYVESSQEKIFTAAMIVRSYSLSIITLQRVPLRMGSPVLQQLQNPTPPLFKDIFFFNLTNPEEFEAGAKPELVEVGPYSYTYVHKAAKRMDNRR